MKGFINVFEIVFISVSSRLMTVLPALCYSECGLPEHVNVFGRCSWKSIQRTLDHHS